MNLEGPWGTSDEFATIPFHLILFSAALVELAKIPVHSLIIVFPSLFLSTSSSLFPFPVPCRIVFAKPKDHDHFLTRVRSLSCSPMAAWIFLQTSSMVSESELFTGDTSKDNHSPGPVIRGASP